MTEQAIYHAEETRWYRIGEEPWRVRFVSKGETLMPDFSVTADSYCDAFEKLYGHSVNIPLVQRDKRREAIQ
jgi:hypothetical protein